MKLEHVTVLPSYKLHQALSLGQDWSVQRHLTYLHNAKLILGFYHVDLGKYGQLSQC